MQIIYIDILFLINFIMDLMIFYVGMQLLGKRVKLYRIILGSAIAAIAYCLVVYFPLLQKLPIYIYYFCIPIIPILYMFKPISLKEFLKEFLVCTLSAFVIGGGTFNFYFILQQVRVSQMISLLLPVCVGVLICIITTISFKWLRKRILLPRFEYDITLHNEEKQKQIEGIIDTGNCLYTILSHRPVNVVYYENIQELLSTTEMDILLKCKKSGIIETMSEIELLGNNFCLIPFKSLGCKEGMILGKEIDQIEINKGSYKRKFNKCIIGICFEPIFTGCKYDALVHPDFIIN